MQVNPPHKVKPCRQKPPYTSSTSPTRKKPEVVLSALIAFYNKLFADRIRAVYTTGSRTDDTSASASDRDEKDLAAAVLDHSRLLSPIRLDLPLDAEDDGDFLKAWGRDDVRLKLGAKLIYGRDIRDQFPMPSLKAYQKYIGKWPQNFITGLHDRGLADEA